MKVAGKRNPAVEWVDVLIPHTGKKLCGRSAWFSLICNVTEKWLNIGGTAKVGKNF